MLKRLSYKYEELTTNILRSLYQNAQKFQIEGVGEFRVCNIQFVDCGPYSYTVMEVFLLGVSVHSEKMNIHMTKQIKKEE